MNIETFNEKQKNGGVMTINDEEAMYEGEYALVSSKIANLNEIIFHPYYDFKYPKSERSFHKKMLEQLMAYRETLHKLLSWKSNQIINEIKIQRG